MILKRFFPNFSNVKNRPQQQQQQQQCYFYFQIQKNKFKKLFEPTKKLTSEMKRWKKF